MSCSKCANCYHGFHSDVEIVISCRGCGDSWHTTCLDDDEVSAYVFSEQHKTIWYCRDCADESETTRDEMIRFWNIVRGSPPRPRGVPQTKEAAGDQVEAGEPSTEAGTDARPVESASLPTTVDDPVAEVKLDQEKETKAKEDKEEPKVDLGN